jgi:hypothetical protein
MRPMFRSRKGSIDRLLNRQPNPRLQKNRADSLFKPHPRRTPTSRSGVNKAWMPGLR